MKGDHILRFWKNWNAILMRRLCQLDHRGTSHAYSHMLNGSAYRPLNSFMIIIIFKHKIRGFKASKNREDFRVSRDSES